MMAWINTSPCLSIFKVQKKTLPRAALFIRYDRLMVFYKKKTKNKTEPKKKKKTFLVVATPGDAQEHRIQNFKRLQKVTKNFKIHP